jgi:hypothetical protein
MAVAPKALNPSRIARQSVVVLGSNESRLKEPAPASFRYWA